MMVDSLYYPYYYKFNITLPLGSTKYHGFAEKGTKFAWTFHVSKYLRINFTVDYLYFSANNYAKCHASRLILVDHLKKFTFCGIHSQIIFLFSGNYHMGSASTYPFVTYDLLIKYSVFDSNNVILWTRTDINSPLIHTLFLESREDLHNFHIIVHKFKSMNLLIARNLLKKYSIIEVYDGPGTISTKLNYYFLYSNIYVIKSSAFQILILIQCKTFLMSVPFLPMTYQSYDPMFQMVEPRKYLNISFPHDKMCDQSTFCSLELRTIPNFYVKIETKYFIYESYYNSSNCIYGGLAAYDKLFLTSHELTTMCRTQDYSFIHRNIYSSSDKLLLIFYFYREYIKLLNIKLHVSTTKCRRIFIDACKEKEQFTSISYDGPIPIREVVCTIYQPVHKLKYPRRGSHCFIALSAFIPSTKNLEAKVHWNVTGFLRTFQHKNVDLLNLTRKYK